MESNQLPKQLCSICANEYKFICGKCKKAKYCSKECQKKAWPQHKKTCIPFDKPLWAYNSSEVAQFIKEEPEEQKKVNIDYIQDKTHEDFEEFVCHICDEKGIVKTDKFFYHAQLLMHIVKEHCMVYCNVCELQIRNEKEYFQHIKDTKHNNFYTNVRFDEDAGTEDSMIQQYIMNSEMYEEKKVCKYC